MGFYEDRTRAVSDHEREALKAPRTAVPAQTPGERERSEESGRARLIQLAPIGFAGLGVLIVGQLLTVLTGPDPLAALAAGAVVVGMGGGFALFLKRPPRLVALAWLGAVAVSLGIAIGGRLAPFSSGSLWLALGLVTASFAAVAATSEEAWRPAPPTWEE